MNSSIYNISPIGLVIAFIPVLITLVIYLRWAMPSRTLVYACFRMVLQLLAIGYVLTYIFGLNNPLGVCAVLTVMMLAASWIALRPAGKIRTRLYGKCLLAIFLCGS